ncbi:MAG: alpha-mannosidase [Candidatus Aminicenantes bacterium]|nr:alpha-mannosidase [Candidatus Aminicenantes bacterium]
MARKRVHLLANAHLDPVWLWEWPEGAGATLSTFRTAAELCERDRSFVFCHNEAVLYQWVEEYEPALFRRIKALVKAGRWSILGGWFLQPDANMPSGESFVRQALIGKRYFREKFGLEVRTAANLDPFGHTRGLVQILAKCGYRSYLFCRPDRNFLRLPGDDFVWVGYDGSEILAGRAEAHYNSRGGQARAKVEDWLRSHPERDLSLVLWGVGDHGGGASRRDLADLRALAAERKDADIFHSSADAYFAELAGRKQELPRVERDLNPWAVGCYTTMARVKQGHRRLENEFFGAEKMAAAAAFQKLLRYPQAELREAQRDLAFAQFHDLLPGSSIPAGEDGVLGLIGHGLEICSRVKARAFFALAAGEAKPAEGAIPVFVYNPHPFRVRTVVECELQDLEPNYDGGFLAADLSRRGRPVASQTEKEASNLSLEWRKKVVFSADLEAGRMNRFDCRLRKIAARPRPSLEPEGGLFRFQSGEGELRIDAGTGLVDGYAVGGREILGPGACQLVVMADNADPWGMSVTKFRDFAGAFILASPEEGTRISGVSRATVPSVRVLEDGPVRTILEAVFVHASSSAVVRYKIPKSGTEFEVEVRVLWNEKDRMLKMSLPTRLADPVYAGQVAYGRDNLPSDGTEAVSQKWSAVVSTSGRFALTVINEGVYGSDFADGEARISLLRGAAHAADPAGERPMLFQDRFIPRIDQGERSFRFWVNAGPLEERLEAVDREALAKNESPYVLAYSPPGTGRKAAPAAVLSDKAVLLAAMKKSEDGNRMVIRLFEPTGRARRTVLSLPFAEARIRLAFSPFEIKTLLFDQRTKTFREADLLERPLGR